jgi:hypothetical protein
MSLGQVALGIASIALGLNSLRKGVKHLSDARGMGGGMGASPPVSRQKPRQNPRIESNFMDREAMPAPVRMPGRAFANSGYSTVRAPNGARVPMQMRSFNIRTLDDRIGYLRRLVDAGKRDPQVYAFGRRAVTRKCGNRWCINEKDNLSEAKAIFDAVRRTRAQSGVGDVATARKLFRQIREQVRYTSDIAGVDTYQKPAHTLALKSGDCLPAGTKLLRADGTFVNIEDVGVGETIFDGVGWTKVTKHWDKGVQNLLSIGLNNGSVLRCTEEHKVFCVPSVRGGSGPAHTAEERLARDVRLGDDLLQPRELAYADGATLSDDMAFLLGAYLSEGSVRRVRMDGTIACVEIAGIPDSKGIRERAAECAERLGFTVALLERMIYVSDSGDQLHTLLNGCGRYAPMKRLPHVCWAPRTAEHILQGLAADGGMSSNGANFVFSTTSAVLALQYRLLQRQFGRSCSIKRVDEHGGFGTNPIYRVTVRQDNQRKPWAKVRSLTSARAEQVFDIETDSHRLYLPEQDVVVHNCDDYSTLTCATLQSVGIPCRLKVIRTKGAKDWNHIYPQAGFPRQNPTKWVSMDSSVNMPFGWEAPPKMVAASRVFPVG